MLKFLAANLELTTPSQAAMRRMRSIRKDTGVPNLDIAMAWHILKKDGSEIVCTMAAQPVIAVLAGFDPVKKQC